jgi:hypothetical protein
MTAQLSERERGPVLTKKPRLSTVLTIVNGERWLLGSSEPGSSPDDPESNRIVDMVQNEDNSVDVFCLPKPESQLVAKQGDVGIVYHLNPNLILRTITLAQREVWDAMRHEMNDHHVAQIASQWLEIPSDMLFEHIQMARDELEAGAAENGEPGEPGDPEPEAAAPPNGGG